MLRRSTTGIALLVLGTLPVNLLAQPAPPASSPAPPASAPRASASSAPASAPEEAQKRYARALELFNEGAYEAALLDFRRAYELAPTWRILFNIGQVNVQLNDYAGALNAFERYLSEGGSEVSASRSSEVKGQIERLKGRIAFVEISSDIPGVELTVDDLPVGKTPLEAPLVVNAGRRRLSASAAGKIPQNRVIEATGGDRIKIRFEMRSPEGPRADSSTQVSSAAPLPPPPSSSIFWPGFIAAGAFGVGAAVVGSLSLGATSDYKATREKFGITREQLDDAQAKARRLSIATDVLLGATVIAGGLSVYLSLREPPASTARQTPGSSVGLGLGPGTAFLRGTF